MVWFRGFKGRSAVIGVDRIGATGENLRLAPRIIFRSPGQNEMQLKGSTKMVTTWAKPEPTAPRCTVPLAGAFQ